MEIEAAIKIAKRHVKKKYAFVPPVVAVVNINKEWTISFKCSWESDLNGIPIALHIIVGDSDGAITIKSEGPPPP